MPWQVVVAVITALASLVLAFANHKFRQIRDYEASQRKVREEMINRHKQACGELLDGVGQFSLAIAMERDRLKSVLSMISNTNEVARNVLVDGSARIRDAERVLQVEPGTGAILEALRAFAAAAKDCGKDLEHPNRVPADERANHDALLKEKMAGLVKAVQMHLDSLSRQPNRPQHWSRGREVARQRSEDVGSWRTMEPL